MKEITCPKCREKLLLDEYMLDPDKYGPGQWRIDVYLKRDREDTK